VTDTAQTASGKSAEARKWAMICHVSALIGLLANGIGFVLAPLIVWLLKKEEHAFVDQQGKEAVNFQLTMLIVLLIGGLLTLVAIGLVVIVIAALVMTIFPIIAAIKANDGVDYRYPFSIRFIK